MTALCPPRLNPDRFRTLNWVFCTHRHSDHMDPGSLPLLARTNSSCRFVAPRAERQAALMAGVPSDRLVTINAGESLSLAENTAAQAVASAHETLKVNDHGEHHFLGFIFRTPRLVLYHSGDCVPYDGLAAQLLDCKIDVALLPVNGRDACRASRNIAGNFSLAEARQLCVDARIPWLVAHHFGMFAFNTPSLAKLRKEAGRAAADGRCLLPAVESYYLLEQGHSGMPSVTEL